MQVVGDDAHRRGDDGLVERGQEHPHHQPGEDGQDLPVRQLAARGGRRGGGGGQGVSPVDARGGRGRTVGDRVEQRAAVLEDAVVEPVQQRPEPSYVVRGPVGQQVREHPVAVHEPLGAVPPPVRWRPAARRPSSGSARRSTRPSATSALTWRLTVDGSRQDAAARADERCGPSLHSANSSMLPAHSMPSPWRAWIWARSDWLARNSRTTSADPRRRAGFGASGRPGGIAGRAGTAVSGRQIGGGASAGP